MIVEIKFKDGEQIFAEVDDFGVIDGIVYLKSEVDNVFLAKFEDIKYIRDIERVPIIDGGKIDENGEVIPDEF